MTFGNAAPQINAKEGRVSASVVSYPYDNQKDIVLVNSRAKTARMHKVESFRDSEMYRENISLDNLCDAFPQRGYLQESHFL